MEGLGVVGDSGPQRRQVEPAVASKGLAAFMFMDFSVHEYDDGLRFELQEMELALGRSSCVAFASDARQPEG